MVSLDLANKTLPEISNFFEKDYIDKNLHRFPNLSKKNLS